MGASEDVYAHIASFYEAEYGALEADVAYYARNGVPGPLLVLGCGTGRVGRVLGATRAVIGLDRSEAMLAIARARAPDGRYVLGDMCDFDLGSFAEIVVPNGAFCFLATRDQQTRCLECCYRALPEGAPLTLDLPMPTFRMLGVPHSPEHLAWEGRVEDVPARRTREVRRVPVAQRIELTDRFYVRNQLVATSPLVLRYVFPAEVEWMLESIGFYVEALHGDYAGSPLRETSPRLLVRAVRL